MVSCCVPGVERRLQELGGRVKGRRGRHRHRTARDTSAMGPGLGADLPVSAWATKEGSLGGGGAPGEGQGCFQSEFKVADGGFGGLEWLAAPGWRGDGREKASWGSSARRPEELPVQDEVRGPA